MLAATLFLGRGVGGAEAAGEPFLLPAARCRSGPRSRLRLVGGAPSWLGDGPNAVSCAADRRKSEKAIVPTMLGTTGGRRTFTSGVLSGRRSVRH
jgi:hypothetical protein